MSKPEQMKSFCEGEKNGNFEGLEASVNDWLAANTDIEIVGRQAVSNIYASNRGEPQIICTIFIFFRRT